MTESKKARGRPQHTTQRKSRSLNLKTSDELRALIDAAASASGRSLTQEVERRLEASFGVSAAAMTTDLGPLFRRMSMLIEMIELRSEKKWTEDSATWFAVVGGIKDLLARFEPDDPAGLLDMKALHRLEGTSEYAAARLASLAAVLESERPGVEVARILQPLPTRHPGLVSADGVHTPVNTFNRS